MIQNVLEPPRAISACTILSNINYSSSCPFASLPSYKKAQAWAPASNPSSSDLMLTLCGSMWYDSTPLEMKSGLTRFTQWMMHGKHLIQIVMRNNRLKWVHLATNFWQHRRQSHRKGCVCSHACIVMLTTHECGSAGVFFLLFARDDWDRQLRMWSDWFKNVQNQSESQEQQNSAEMV